MLHTLRKLMKPETETKKMRSTKRRNEMETGKGSRERERREGEGMTNGLYWCESSINISEGGEGRNMIDEREILGKIPI